MTAGAGRRMANGLRTYLRPDGRCVVRPNDRWTAEHVRRALEYGRAHGVTVITHLADERTDEQRVLVDGGFSPTRREAIVEIQLDEALAAIVDAPLPEGIAVISAADADADRLRRLDDELRDDVPGTSGWRSTPEEFASDNFGDPAFNPQTYLVAVERDTGEYIGLVRVWMHSAGPRIGMFGVRRAHRRRGIASTLLAQCLRAAREAGHATATTAVDETNDASRGLLERIGARRIGTSIELALRP